MRNYHIGFYKKGKTLVMQVVSDKDCLSPELFQYLGERRTTKKQLREQLKNEQGFWLAHINKNRAPEDCYNRFVVEG